MQNLIAAPLNPAWNAIPKTADEWKARVNANAAAALQALPALRQELHVKVEPLSIDGVKAYMVTPENIPPENRQPAARPCAWRLLRALPRRGRDP